MPVLDSRLIRPAPPSPPTRSAWPSACRSAAPRRPGDRREQSKRERFEQRGQLLPRERIAWLLDRGSGFLELSRLAGLGMHDDDGKKAVLGGGSIVGIGTVAGKRVLISASDSGVKGGTVPPMGIEEGAARAGDRAREQAAADRAGGVGRRQPDVPGGDLRRRRAQLRQPGAPVGGRHSADRGGARLVHRRRRLPAGAVGLRGAGARAQQHLPRRPAAGEGGDRRGRDRRGTRRRRHARRGHRPGRIPGRERCACHRTGTRADGQAALGCSEPRDLSRSRASSARS